MGCSFWHKTVGESQARQRRASLSRNISQAFVNVWFGGKKRWLLWLGLGGEYFDLIGVDVGRKLGGGSGDV